MSCMELISMAILASRRAYVELDSPVDGTSFDMDVPHFSKSKLSFSFDMSAVLFALPLTIWQENIAVVKVGRGGGKGKPWWLLVAWIVNDNLTCGMTYRHTHGGYNKGYKLKLTLEYCI